MSEDDEGSSADDSSLQPSPPTALRNAIPQLFDSEKYSDAQINCGRTSWNAHQLVICEQSNLGTIMTGPKGAKIIDLDQHNPDAVQCMLEYLYTGDSSIFAAADAAGVPSSEIAIYVFILAKCFKIASLKYIAQEVLNENICWEWDTARFAPAAAIGFKSSTSSDIKFRKFIVSTIVKLRYAIFNGDGGATPLAEMLKVPSNAALAQAVLAELGPLAVANTPVRLGG